MFDYFSKTCFKIYLETEQMIKKVREVRDEKLKKLIAIENEAKANSNSLDRNQLELDKVENLSKD